MKFNPSRMSRGYGYQTPTDILKRSNYLTRTFKINLIQNVQFKDIGELKVVFGGFLGASPQTPWVGFAEFWVSVLICRQVRIPKSLKSTALMYKGSRGVLAHVNSKDLIGSECSVFVGIPATSRR
jgi:hypothetical protein